MFWEVVGLERGPLSLVSTTEELLDRKVAAPVWKTENTAVGTWPRGALYPQRSALTLSTSGGRSVGIVRSRTQTMEFSLVLELDCGEKYWPGFVVFLWNQKLFVENSILLCMSCAKHFSTVESCLTLHGTAQGSDTW
jgi:hypothetical protein